jgi:hypothetical protein
MSRAITLFLITQNKPLTAKTPLANLQTRAEEQGCTVGSLEGSFGVTFSGWARTAAGESPRAGVQRITFDGDGHFDGTQTTVRQGIPVRRTFVGSYSMNSDCTGSFVLTFTDQAGGEVRSDFVVDDNGNELRQVLTSAPADPLTVTTIGRKQVPR